MSRTIRRKHAEHECGPSAWNNKGCGLYSQYDWIEHNGYHMWVIRAPTPAEYFHTYKHYHIHSGSSCMTVYARQHEEKVARTRARTDISNFLHGKVNDVVATRSRKSPSWWW